jgi:hypothetical protein
VPFGVVDLFEIGVVGNRFDTRLQRQNLIIACGHDHRMESQPFCGGTAVGLAKFFVVSLRDTFDVAGVTSRLRLNPGTAWDPFGARILTQDARLHVGSGGF